MRVNLQGKETGKPMWRLIFTILALLLLQSACSQSLPIDFQYNNLFRWRITRLPAQPKTDTRPANSSFLSEFFTATVKPAPLPATWYASHMAWTCQKEWQWEKNTRIPIRIRLGSKEQVDWLEGKK